MIELSKGTSLCLFAVLVIIAFGTSAYYFRGIPDTTGPSNGISSGPVSSATIFDLKILCPIELHDDSSDEPSYFVDSGIHPSKLLLMPVPKIVYTSRETTSGVTLSHFVDFTFFFDQAQHFNIQHESRIRPMVSHFCKSTKSRNSRSTVLSSINVFIGKEHMERKVKSLHDSANEMGYDVTKLTSQSISDSFNNEEYILELTPTVINIVAHSVDGYNMAIASLTQLLSSPVPLPGLPFVIHDWPTNSWRGLLIDLSRHFQPVDLLKRNIDAMANAKFNILHLHLTDSQSFPIQLDDVGELKLSDMSRKGAFSKEKVYSKQDLRELVRYAIDRGITIIPEIDTPAHTLSWSRSFPEILVNCSMHASHQQTPHNIYPLNPTNNHTYHVIYHVLKQIAEIFPSKYLHVGGDEVDLACWQEDDGLMEHIRRRKISMNELFQEFESRVFAMARELGKIPIVWQGVLDAHSMPIETYDGNTSFSNSHFGLYESTTKLSTKAIVEPWKCWSGLAVRASANAYKAQHPSVMSACWYLDYDSDWRTYLATDLITSAVSSVAELPENATKFDETTARKDYFIGGEAAMWTENVDVTNLECRIWPRAVAVSTRLWGYEINQPMMIPALKTHHPSALRNPINHRQLDDSTIDYSMLSPKMSVLHFPSKLPRTRQLSTNIVASIEVTRHLYEALVHFRFFLLKTFYVNAADIIFHIPEDSRHHLNRNRPHRKGAGHHVHGQRRLSTTRGSMKPYVMTDELEAIKLISLLNYTTTLSSSGPLHGLPPEGLAITSRCLGITEKIQRPLKSNRVSLAQINIANGAVGKRLDLLQDWLQTLSNDGIAFVGFCELNQWQELQSTVELYKNLPKMSFRAAAAGFVHSHVMTSQQPYSIGLVSALPFVISGQYGPPSYQRGVLHVTIPTLDLHVFVVHLHAHDPKSRAKEALLLRQLVVPLIRSSKKVLVMGDFNTLSPWDKGEHDRSELVKVLSGNSHEVFPRLRRKFLLPSADRVDYEPMDILLRSGLRDSCVEYCRQIVRDSSVSTAIETSFACYRDAFNKLNMKPTSNSNTTIKKNETCIRQLWTISGSDEFSRCMTAQCPFSQPTQFNPEWIEESIGVPQPKIRLDFVLASEAIFQTSSTSTPYSGCLEAFVEDANATREISDHFPVHFSFPFSTDLIQINTEKSCFESQKSFNFYG